MKPERIAEIRQNGTIYLPREPHGGIQAIEQHEVVDLCSLAQEALTQRWRPIEEAKKLPGKTLWGCDNRTPEAPIYYSIQWQGIGSHGPGWYMKWDSTYVSGAVTHYMPLPAAPKAGEKP